MARKRSFFEAKVVGSILVTVIIVISIGILAYRSMSGIIRGISEEAKPDMKLVVLKNILSDLSDAESGVKSYSITKNRVYLEPFYLSVSSIDEKINQLYILSGDNAQQHGITDTLKSLVEQKFIVLNQLLLLDQDSHVEATLEKISAKLAESEREKNVMVESPAKEKEETVKQPEPKSNIMAKIFGKKEPKKAPKTDQAKTTTTVKMKKVKEVDINSIRNVQKEIQEIKKQEVAHKQENVEKQLVLIRKDKYIMDKIRISIVQLEILEKRNIAEKKRIAERMADEAIAIIGVFCIAVSLLMIALGYVMIDNTRKNRAYSVALRKAKDEAENLTKIKASFLSTMSHEIRTPMNAISGFAEQLASTSLKKDQKQYVDIVRKSSEHLLSIINDILDFSKLGAGKLELEKIGFVPTQLIEDTIAMLHPKATEKNIGLSYKIEHGIPEIIKGDPVRLRQILINIIGNAVKFTERGEVTVHCVPVLENETKMRLQIAVKDTGIGISTAQQKRIFNEFEQAESSISRKYGGSGLGLAITRKLILLQGGTIQVLSEEGKGTTITITIPYEIGDKHDLPADKSLQQEQFMLPATSVLVADDEEYNRILVTTILRKWGVSYTEVSNGEEVLKELKQKSYDIVLMDVQMPIVNGIDATEEIRKNKSQIPIIALTASTSKETLDRCMEVGMNDILIKPFRESELYYKILSLQNGNTLMERPIDLVTYNEEFATKRYDISEICDMANGDESFVVDMLKVFIRTTRESIAEMRNGVNNNSIEEVAHHAHKVAAPCRHIEAMKLYSLLKQVEEKIRTNELFDLKEVMSEIEKETDELIGFLEEEVNKRIK